MKTTEFIVVLVGLVCLCGCVADVPYGSPQRPAILKPTLPPGESVAVVVVDGRHHVDTGKTPSDGNLDREAPAMNDWAAEGMASDISKMVMQYGGAGKAHPAPAIPRTGPAIRFEITRWHSRTQRAPQKPSASATGRFEGTLSLYRDGEVVATEKIAANASGGAIDARAAENRSDEMLRSMWLMLAAAAEERAQMNGLVALHSALAKNWGLMHAEGGRADQSGPAQ